MELAGGLPSVNSRSERTLRGLLLRGGKPGNFIAGR